MENKLLDDYKCNAKHSFYNSVANARRKNEECGIGSTDTQRSRRIFSRKRCERDNEKTSLAGYHESTADYYSVDPQEATSDEEYEPAVEKKISSQNRVPECNTGKGNSVEIFVSHYSDIIEKDSGILEDSMQEKQRLSISTPAKKKEVTGNEKWDPEVGSSDIKNYTRDYQTFLQEQNLQQSGSSQNNELQLVVDEIPEIELKNYERSLTYLQKNLNDQPLVRTRSSGTRVIGDKAEIDLSEEYRRQLSPSKCFEGEEEQFPQKTQIKNETTNPTLDEKEIKHSADTMRSLREKDIYNLLEYVSEKSKKYSVTDEILKCYLSDRAGVKSKKRNANTVTFHSLASTLEALQNEQRKTMDKLAKTLVASNTEDILTKSPGTSRITLNNPVPFEVQDSLHKKSVAASSPLKIKNSSVDQLKTSPVANKICATDTITQKKVHEDIGKLTEVRKLLKEGLYMSLHSISKFLNPLFRLERVSATRNI